MPPKANDAIATALADLKDEIKSIHSKLDSHFQLFSTQENKIKNLELLTNDIEQHQRLHSIRIFGLPLPPTDTNDPFSVTHHVYTALTPILEIAKDKKSLPCIPPLLDTIDISHTLPSRDNSTPPIIVRFKSKLIRLAVMRHKKAYFTNNSDHKFSITDDLTRKNSLLLKFTKERSDVASAWSSGCKIKYKLKSDPNKILTASITALPSH